MPSITNNQGKQIREAMGSMKDKDQKRSYLYALLGYAPPKSTTSPHEKKESKLEEKKEKVAGKMKIGTPEFREHIKKRNAHKFEERLIRLGRKASDED